MMLYKIYNQVDQIISVPYLSSCAYEKPGAFFHFDYTQIYRSRSWS